MLQMTFWEKIEALFNIVKSSNFLIFLFGFVILLGFVLYDTYRYERKTSIKIFSYVYIVIFIALILKYKDSLLGLLDYLMNNLAVIFYFPNLAVFILIIVLTNIIMLGTVFRKRMSKFNRILNVVCYSTITFLMFIVFDYVIKENIDVYDYPNLLTDKTLLAVLQFTTIIFVIWVIILLIIKIYRKLKKKDCLEVVIDNSKCLMLEEENNKLNIENDRLFNEIQILKDQVKSQNTELDSLYDKLEQDFTTEEYNLLLNMLKYIQNNQKK